MTALITGASSGIGEGFANAFAERKTDVVLVARSGDKLHRLAQNLRDRHPIRAEVIVQDLTEPDGAIAVGEAVRQKNIQIDTLVNNAGFGDYGDFATNSRSKQLGIVRLNVLALTDLTYQFLPAMQERGGGQILNIASITGFQPMPYLAVYAATKAFILSFSEALWAENRERGVRILAVCPGPVDKTNFFAVAGFNPFKTAEEAARKAETPESVVREAFLALEQGKSTVVTGKLSNHLITKLPRFLPRQAIARAVEMQFRP